MRARVVPVLVAMLLLLAALPAHAQFRQYAAPGELGQEQVPTKERLEAAMENARWSLGPVRLAPWVGLRSLTYYDDVFPLTPGKQSDLTASAGAGLSAFLPVGPRFVLAAHALPEYVWWRDLDQRRVWNGSYGAGMFGYFNRLTAEVSVATERDATYMGSEEEAPVNQRQDRGHALVELFILRRLSVFASGDEVRWRYREEDLPGEAGQRLLFLDRDETMLTGGVRYRFRDWLTIGAGVQRFESEFLREAGDRSNRGTGPMLELRARRGRLSAEINVARVDLEPIEGSTFAPFQSETGQARVGLELRERWVWTVYGGRNLTFSFLAPDAYYLNKRYGTSLQLPLGWRAGLALFGEKGSNEYFGIETGDGAVSEDTIGFGATAIVKLGRNIDLTIGATRTEYDANVEGFDRSFTRIQTGLTFGFGSPLVL